MGDGAIEPVGIRIAEPADLAAIARIVHDAYVHYIARIGKPPGPMQDDYAARIAAGQAWVALHEGDVAGVVVIESAEGRCLLDNIAVAPSAQGRGVGKALLDFAEARARAGGHREITLYTHALMTENIGLYRRRGYAETARITEKGFERVYMAKPLG